MLTIRMQRTGRKGHANFRVVVQDSRQTPTSGKVVALLGSYNPHEKTSVIDKEKAAHFLKNGAQPSERVALLLQKEGVKLPSWVKINAKKSKQLRNPEKLRKNRPAEEVSAEAEKPVAEPAETEPETAPAQPATEASDAEKTTAAPEAKESEQPAEDAPAVETEA